MRRYTFLLFCLIALLAGCEESVAPFVGEQRPFTIWGYLNTGADTQRVRVFTIEERIGADRAGPIDATVASLDLDTGERRVWKDSEVVYYDGSVGHVFWSAFRAQSGHRYRLEVMRSDGAVSSAQATAPPPVEVQMNTGTNAASIPVKITGGPAELVGLEVVYRVVPAYPLNVWPIGATAPPTFVLPVAVSYDGRQEKEADGWNLRINMQEDFQAVKAEMGKHCLPEEIVLQRIEFRFLAADTAWVPPGGVFDLETLIEPGAFSNVENGFGFFGAGRSVNVQWVPARAVQTTLGFALGAPCPMMPAPGCEIKTPPCYRCEDRLTPQIRAVYCRVDTPPP